MDSPVRLTPFNHLTLRWLRHYLEKATAGGDTRTLESELSAGALEELAALGLHGQSDVDFGYQFQLDYVQSGSRKTKTSPQSVIDGLKRLGLG